MVLRNLLASILFLLHTSVIGAPGANDYRVPLTEYGQPDFQAVWTTAFLTLLERPDHVTSLTVSSEQAAVMATSILAEIPDVRDPDDYFGIYSLAKVKGEFRTSVIVKPDNSLVPYTTRGMELAAQSATNFFQGFDHPEQRPLGERCLGGFGEPPIRAIPVMLYHQFIQTENHIVLHSEDPTGYRIVHLNQTTPDGVSPSLGGRSVGHWDGNTLVVETSHFRSDYPARLTMGRPVLIGENTRVEERFTRVSETELHYSYVVEDSQLYTEHWSGEFSMTRDKGPIYEYACHEGNYSLPSILLGGRRQTAEQ